MGLTTGEEYPLPEPATRYRLAQDDSCHWYLIPADRQKDWWDWMESEDAKLGVEPEWAKRIDGWSLLTFTDPQEDN